MRVPMVAISKIPFTYGTRRLRAGDTFEADNDGHCALLTRRGLAIDPNSRDRVPLAPPPPAFTAALDAAARPEAPADDGRLPALRKAYAEALGKRPFPGWGAEELERRIAAAQEA
jgi:hypothetical protein